MAGEEPETGPTGRWRRCWQKSGDTSEPDWASATEDLRFCGFEFAVDASGVKMHQQS